MITQKTKTKFDLIQDNIRPSEAKALVNSYYEKSINHYKIQKLRAWIHNHNANTSYYDELIKSLLNQKKKAIETINVAIERGCDIELKGNMNLNLAL